MSAKLSLIWALVQADQIEDIMDTLGAAWWRCHKLAVGLPDPWAALDAELLAAVGAARRMLRDA